MLIPCKKTTCILRYISHMEDKVQIGNNQWRSPFWNIILSSCSMYLHLFKIAIYLWLGSIRSTTEFQFAFCCKITQNYIFEATYCRWIILIFSLFEKWQRSLFCNHYLVLCDKTRQQLWRRQHYAWHQFISILLKSI